MSRGDERKGRDAKKERDRVLQQRLTKLRTDPKLKQKYSHEISGTRAEDLASRPPWIDEEDWINALYGYE